MQLYTKPYNLLLKHPFTLGNGTSRTSTPIVFVKLEHDGYTGYGEASMPPYLGESHESALRFLNSVDLSSYNDPSDIEGILAYVDGCASDNPSAKAAIDIALHDLLGKIHGKTCFRMLGYTSTTTPEISCTIGIDSPEMLKQKVAEASLFNVLKIKLGTENDKELINAIRSVTDKPLYVDVNQGWKEKEHALDLIYWLQEKGIKLIEQPLLKGRLDEVAWLTERSPLPIIADEDCQRLVDIDRLQGVYSGINIKLMKCTGIHEAGKMIKRAKELNLKILIGCMSESTCATMAAASLSSAADWVDLDGPFLVKNNPFRDPELLNGTLVLPELPGLGLKLIDEQLFKSI